MSSGRLSEAGVELLLAVCHDGLEYKWSEDRLMTRQTRVQLSFALTADVFDGPHLKNRAAALDVPDEK